MTTVRFIGRADGMEPAAVTFGTWLAKAAKGDRYTYHRGQTGDHERWTFIAASHGVDTILTVYADTAGGAAHKAYIDGLAHLCQRTDGSGMYDYIAERR